MMLQYLDKILTNIWRQIDIKLPAGLGENDLLHFENTLYKISIVEWMSIWNHSDKSVILCVEIMK